MSVDGEAGRARPDWLGRGTVRRDVLLLLTVGLVLFGAGLGQRDPWPADEPRFALIARDMALTGDWFFPRVGGDLYQDKPPVFFWAIGSAFLLTGDLRLSFLLPSLLAALGTLLFVYDLGRRVWSREAGLAGALLLACSLQFVLQARAAQIDMLLTFFTTAALYGIGRHLFLGPDWRAYAFGGAAAGIGVITKGTGFLPLLLPLVFVALRRTGFTGLAAGAGGARWALAPAAALAAIGLWLLPMIALVALSGAPELAAYRDEILFRQTVTRYVAAWGHREPWHYFIVSVIPGLWLPGTALLPWLVPGWRRAFAARDGRPLLFLGWALLVVAFFSASSGKRGVYVLPALPAFALAAAPLLPALLARAGVARVLFALAAALAALAAGGYVYLAWLRPDALADLETRYGVTSVAPLLAVAVAIGTVLILLRVRRGALAWAASLAVVALVQGYWIAPMVDEARSGRAFMARVEAQVPQSRELGVVDYREQYLLQSRRPLTNFGHRRYQDPLQEVFDAAAWLAAEPGRMLMVGRRAKDRCFARSPAVPLGEANRIEWFLVEGPPDPDCAALGHLAAARRYVPPPLP